MQTTMALDMSDGMVSVNKQLVGIWHTRSIFKSALYMHNVSNIGSWKRNDRESNPRPQSRESNALSSYKSYPLHHRATVNCEKIF